MTTVTLELSSEIYQQLYDKYHKQAITEQARQILNTANLETQLSPELQKLAENSTATLEQVQASFSRAGGQALSEMVIEMRDYKLLNVRYS